MTLEQEISDLQRQRDDELKTLRYTASRTKRDLTRAVNPDRQIRKHLGIALGAAVLGGYLLAPSGSRREKRDKKGRVKKSRRAGLMQTLLHYFPQLAQVAPFLAKQPPGVDDESDTGVHTPHGATPASAGGISSDIPHAFAEDYGREDEPVRPFSTPHYDDDTPVTEDRAAYEGYTSDAAFDDRGEQPRGGRAYDSDSQRTRSSRKTVTSAAAAPIKAILATLLADLAARVDWQQIINQVQHHFLSKLQQTADPPEPPSVAVADAGATSANDAFGGRFTGHPDIPKG